MAMSNREYPDRPIAGVGALVINQGRVLLVKRGIQPGLGLWAIPGGLQKVGETLQEGAEREILEETGVRIKAGEPFYIFDFMERDESNKIRYHYIIVDLKADYLNGEVKAGDDAADARWLSSAEINELPVSVNTLNALRRVGFV